jgi:hypothetical protein
MNIVPRSPPGPPPPHGNLFENDDPLIDSTYSSKQSGNGQLSRMDDDEDDEPDDMLMRILAVRAVAVEMVGEQQWDALGKSYVLRNMRLG